VRQSTGQLRHTQGFLDWVLRPIYTETTDSRARDACASVDRSLRAEPETAVLRGGVKNTMGFRADMGQRRIFFSSLSLGTRFYQKIKISTPAEHQLPKTFKVRFRIA